ncbi:PTS system, galactitol-specific IIC component protein [Escherichia coli]|uniref:PTS system, galactitol-specific IIC component protein n=1 Tax=Escherichia coli TaxID=562 RepID=A0A376TDB7_ECOLX|nr:PTS system, galactitol-specific IIC component protein [Escherichia coli]
MAENFDLNLHVVDVGWPGSSPMTWASQIAAGGDSDCDIG